MDLKEFIKNELDSCPDLYVDCNPTSILKEYNEKLGLFFWKRGGKQFVMEYVLNDFDSKVSFSKQLSNRNKYLSVSDGRHCLLATDFLDALACLGEEKVKELIKELK